MLTNVFQGVIMGKNWDKSFDEDGFESLLLESRRLVQADSKFSSQPITSELKGWNIFACRSFRDCCVKA